jgi:hypothetical protein
MTHKYLTIPASLVTELESWGEVTARLFGELRRDAGLKPAVIPEDQAWFWTDGHQAKERLVDEEFKYGDYEDFDDVEELIKALHAYSEKT